MAYRFVRSSSQYFTQSVAGRSIAGPATLAAVFVASDATSNQVQISIRNGNGKFMLYLVATSKKLAAADYAYSAETTTAYTLNDTGYVAGKFSTSNVACISRVAFFNGGGSSENTATGDDNSSAFNEVGIGARYTGSWGAFFNGTLAETAIWSVHLTDAEIASLAKGFSPKRVRPQSLVFYAPLVRNLIDLRNSVALTASASAPTVANHPRVY